MVSHSDLAKAFVSGSIKGTGSRMLIIDRAICSYGTHFPISLRLGNNKFLFNTDKYSCSTSKHQSITRHAVNGVNGEIIECSTNDIKRAINYPDEPIVIEREIEYTRVDECFNNIKSIFYNKNIKRVPIKKWKQIVNDWELLKCI